MIARMIAGQPDSHHAPEVLHADCGGADLDGQRDPCARMMRRPAHKQKTRALWGARVKDG
jgi:hypothetical protein